MVVLCFKGPAMQRDGRWQWPPRKQEERTGREEGRKEREWNVAEVAESRHFWHPVLIYHSKVTHTTTDRNGAALPYKLVTKSCGDRKEGLNWSKFIQAVGPVIDGGAEGDPSGHTDREADLERGGGGGDKKGCSFREALQRGPGQVSVRYRSVVLQTDLEPKSYHTSGLNT